MSKAALLSSGGNVFEALLVYRLFKERWYDEVDAFYINFNNHTKIPFEVFAKFCGEVTKDPKVHLITHPEGIGNGPPITELLGICKQDLIILLEDDFFIFTPGIVSENFSKIESGDFDIIGSPRYTHGEVAEAAKKKYDLDYSGYGDTGFGWWPTGFYCRREDLLKTDLDFGSKQYTQGEYYKELDHTFSETCYTDTFTWASLQLRYLGLKDFSIPQNHADPYELEQKNAKEGNWKNGQPKYIHGGSLSSGWGGYLSGATPDIQSETNMREIETRCAFWFICAEEGQDSLPEFSREYQTGITELINRCGLNIDRIQAKHKLYRELMNV